VCVYRWVYVCICVSFVCIEPRQEGDCGQRLCIIFICGANGREERWPVIKLNGDHLFILAPDRAQGWQTASTQPPRFSSALSFKPSG